jgi:hypothetical protein
MLNQEAVVAHQQQIVVLDAIIHSALQCAFILFELYNTLVERCPAILSNDSFGSSSQFNSLVQKQRGIKNLATSE